MRRARRRLRELGDVSGRQVAPHRREARGRAASRWASTTSLTCSLSIPVATSTARDQVDLSDLSVGDEAAIFAEVTKVSSRRTRQGKVMVEVTVSDGGESIKVVFFNQGWRERQLPVGVQALFFGKVGDYRGQRQMANPVVDVIVGATGEERDPSRVGRVVAIYPASGKAGLTSWEMGGFIEESLRRAGRLFDPLPERFAA